MQILPLESFESGVVYLSPKPRQIRMYLSGVKQILFAPCAVRKDADKSELSYSLPCSVMGRWRSVDNE